MFVGGLVPGAVSPNGKSRGRLHRVYVGISRRKVGVAASHLSAAVCVCVLVSALLCIVIEQRVYLVHPEPSSALANRDARKRRTGISEKELAQDNTHLRFLRTSLGSPDQAGLSSFLLP